MAAEIRLSGGDIVTSDGIVAADVLIADGKIVALERRGARAGSSLSVAGCLVLPGGVDPHTHLLADVERASVSALHGGTTTAFTFPLPRPAESAVAALRRAREDVIRDAVISVGIHASYLDPETASRAELELLSSLGAFGIQVFLAFAELGLMFGDGRLYWLLQEAARVGLVAQVQCESGSLIEARTSELLESGRGGVAEFPASRPPEAEEQAVYRALSLARLAGADVYLVHLSTARSLELVQAARRSGQKVALELCTHHLSFDETVYGSSRAERFVVAPPLRRGADVEALWRAVGDGSATAIGSDHSQLQPEAEAAGDFTELPMGLPGVELRVPIMLSEGLRRRVSAPRLAALLSTGAAQAFGIAGEKGTIRPGADADLVVWDPSAHWTVKPELLHDGLGATPYAGYEVQGSIRYVLVGGRVVIAEGELVETPRGRLLEATAR